MGRAWWRRRVQPTQECEARISLVFYTSAASEQCTVASAFFVMGEEVRGARDANGVANKGAPQGQQLCPAPVYCCS